MISAKELEAREQRKKEVRKELYTRILQQMCRKIDLMNSLGKSECLLTVPEFIFGYPAYNIYDVTYYTHRQLIRLGYRCSLLESTGKIHVAWGKKKTTETQASTSKQNEPLMLPTLANLKKAADSLRKKYETK